MPVLYGTLFTRKGTEQQCVIKIVCDSGTSSTIVSGPFTKKLRMKEKSENTWNTKGGNFTTSYKAKVQFTLPELDSNKVINLECQVDNNNKESRYDMIIGRDLLSELKFCVDFGNNEINCREGPFTGCSTRMKDINDVLAFTGFDDSNINEINESEPVRKATERVDGIQAARYKKQTYIKPYKDATRSKWMNKTDYIN